MVMGKLILVTTVTSHPRGRTTKHDPEIIVEIRLRECRLGVLKYIFVFCISEARFNLPCLLPSPFAFDIEQDTASGDLII